MKLLPAPPVLAQSICVICGDNCVAFTRCDLHPQLHGNNFGLFHFKDEKGRDEPPDDLTLGLEIDDDKLKSILNDLYYPDSPYEFSVLPADILGQVYEQFLGKVIRLTKAHHAKIEEKPEVRKAGGVYYTPTYIVDYIVANTVGKLCKGKTPAQVAKLRILDPACGSGSFLLGAYQYLLDWHRDYYIEEGAAKHKKKLYQITDKQWRLTAEERKRILINNIYGVDIDPQAVEVTKLSLLLKVLEGENEETLNRQMQMFHQRALPDLGSNIKCGNSLIGSDFYQGRQTGMFDAEEQYRINAFDWDVEFAEIMLGESRYFWFVTFVTHNSRISERMLDKGLSRGKGLKPLASKPLVFTPDDQVLIAEKIAEACQRHKVPVVAWNVLADHVHMVIAAETEQELNEHVRKIKGYSSRQFQKALGWEIGNKVWAQKFNRKPIKDEKAFYTILNYVQNNHLKHSPEADEDEVDNGLKPIVSEVSKYRADSTATATDKGFKPLVSKAPLVSRERIEPILNSIIVSAEEASQGAGGFDAVIGNPPYDVLEKERKGSDQPHQILREYVRINPEYELALGGKLNLYRFFIVRSLNLLKDKKRFGMIIPLSLLADISCAKCRKHLMTSSNNLLADCFPQKDDPKRRVFRNAKLSTAVITCSKYTKQIEKKAKIRMRVFPGRSFEETFQQSEIKLIDLKLLDPNNIPIPLVARKDWELCRKIHSKKEVRRLGDEPCFDIRRGEINQTIYRKYISSDTSMARLLKGVEVGQYLIHIKLSQGEREWFNEKKYLADGKSNIYSLKRRLATQRITGVDERLRIVATLIEPTTHFADSTNSISLTSKVNYDIQYLLGLLNSNLFQWRFKITSSNNNVGTNELASMPFATIDFNDPEDIKRHDRMVELVERMLELNKQLADAKVPDTAQRLKRQIAATDTEIDNLVYELYGLTDEEIKIIRRGDSRRGSS
ncbi:transposase [candidate division WOR-3 bacterium]|nr:transposase [candidate division WOR-3 bacterium]